MDLNLMRTFSNELESVNAMVLIINAFVHLIFAGAVAKDAGLIAKTGKNTYLVTPIIWAFATLVGGIFVAAIYWFMHHLNLTKLKS